MLFIIDAYAVGSVFASYVNHGLELPRQGVGATNTPILIKLLLFQVVYGSQLTTKNADYITFSGSGEPTLNEGIGDVTQFLKPDFSQYTDAWVQPVGPNRLKNISDFPEGADIVKYESAPPEMATRHEDLIARRCNIAATDHLWT